MGTRHDPTHLLRTRPSLRRRKRPFNPRSATKMGASWSPGTMFSAVAVASAVFSLKRRLQFEIHEARNSQIVGVSPSVLGGVSGTIIRLSRHRASPTEITRESVLQLTMVADSAVLFGYSRASSSPRSKGTPNTESRTVGLNRAPFK